MNKINKTARDSIRGDVKMRLIQAAIHLLQEGGREALTTRAIAELAEVQAPTLYRQFGDMRGLLDAVAEHGVKMALQNKKSYQPGDDPINDLRHMWDMHVDFGLANPGIYSLCFGEIRPDMSPPAAGEAKRLLSQVIERIALTGRLMISETRATSLVYSASSGVVLTLLNTPESERDIGLSHDMRDAVIASMTNETVSITHSSMKTAAITLRASVTGAESLSPGEKMLLNELLGKIAKSS